MGLPLKNFMKIKASRFPPHPPPPQGIPYFFTLLLKKSSIFSTYPGRIPFPGNKNLHFVTQSVVQGAGCPCMVHGLKKLITKHGYQNFILFGMVPDTFFSLVFTRRKKWEKIVWKKRAKWRKRKERLQIANNHSYCLDVSIFFIRASSRGLNTESV